MEISTFLMIPLSVHYDRVSLIDNMRYALSPQKTGRGTKETARRRCEKKTGWRIQEEKGWRKVSGTIWIHQITSRWLFLLLLLSPFSFLLLILLLLLLLLLNTDTFLCWICRKLRKEEKKRREEEEEERRRKSEDERRRKEDEERRWEREEKRKRKEEERRWKEEERRWKEEMEKKAHHGRGVLKGKESQQSSPPSQTHQYEPLQPVGNQSIWLAVAKIYANRNRIECPSTPRRLHLPIVRVPFLLARIVCPHPRVCLALVVEAVKGEAVY